MENEMSDKELIAITIDRYTDLQQIKITTKQSHINKV